MSRKPKRGSTSMHLHSSDQPRTRSCGRFLSSVAWALHRGAPTTWHTVGAGALLGLGGLSIAGFGWPAVAHDRGGLTAVTAWSAWQFTPDIVIGTLLVALVYVAGMARHRAAQLPQILRHVAFFTGLAVVFLALQSPIDTISEHLFAMHQAQHLLLRMLGPMLIVVAAPQAMLIAGLPSWARKGALAPLASSRGLRMVFAILAHPFVVTMLFIGVLYFWQIPRYHDLALLDEPVHYGMHAAMLVAGLLFWWRIFDRRGPPVGLRYGVRLMLLWLVLLSNIVLGAYTTFKATVLYRAYDVLGRFGDVSPSSDEHLGGIIIWIPSSMMCLIAVLAIIHMWGRQETRLERRQIDTPNNPVLRISVHGGRRAPAPHAISDREVLDSQKSKNRALALGFGAFAAAVFTAVLLVGIVSHLMGAGVLEASSRNVGPASTRLLHPGPQSRGSR